MTGSSFYLWVMESYPGLVRLVEILVQEGLTRQGGGGAGLCDDPDCVCGGGAGLEDEEISLNLSS